MHSTIDTVLCAMDIGEIWVTGGAFLNHLKAKQDLKLEKTMNITAKEGEPKLPFAFN